MRARVLIVDDEPKFVRILELLLDKEDYRLTTLHHGALALRALERQTFDVVLTDLQMPNVDGIALLERAREIDPDLPVIVITAFGTIGSAVEAMRRGAFDYVEKPFDDAELKLQIRRAVEVRQLKRQNRSLRSTLGDASGFDAILGSSPALRAAVDLARKVAVTEATVLLLGESGTGKEVFARAIHQESARAAGPFVKVNCAAVPATLIEAELFGVERGAFTGADRVRPGRCERADGGTLFLDEIGELEISVQAKLLRVLEERVVERLGGGEAREVDVRFIAATNRDLEAAARNGSFRLDLFHRLAVFPIRLPPLRERLQDVADLVPSFLARFNEAMGRQVAGISPAALTKLQSFAWPGNVRQLANVIERAMIICGESVLQPGHFSVPEAEPDVPGAALVLPTAGVALDELERSLLRQALERSGGNKAQAAKLLGLTRNTLRYRLEKHGLD